MESKTVKQKRTKIPRPKVILDRATLRDTSSSSTGPFTSGSSNRPSLRNCSGRGLALSHLGHLDDLHFILAALRFFTRFPRPQLGWS